MRMRSSTSTPDSASRAAVQGIGHGGQGARRRAGDDVEPLHCPFEPSEPLLDAFEHRDQGRFG